jgi:hypothetical protein
MKISEASPVVLPQARTIVGTLEERSENEGRAGFAESHSTVFPARCGRCHEEGIYSLGEIIDLRVSEPGYKSVSR